MSSTCLTSLSISPVSEKTFRKSQSSSADVNMYLFRNRERKQECVRDENPSDSHTIIKRPEWFSLKHLKPSWLEMQQVSCSSAGGLVIEGLAGVSRGRDD